MKFLVRWELPSQSNSDPLGPWRGSGIRSSDQVSREPRDPWGPRQRVPLGSVCPCLPLGTLTGTPVPLAVPLLPVLCLLCPQPRRCTLSPIASFSPVVSMDVLQPSQTCTVRVPVSVFGGLTGLGVSLSLFSLRMWKKSKVLFVIITQGGGEG